MNKLNVKYTIIPKTWNELCEIGKENGFVVFNIGYDVLSNYDKVKNTTKKTLSFHNDGSGTCCYNGSMSGLSIEQMFKLMMALGIDNKRG